MQIFIAFFVKAPDTLELFRHFRGKAISVLPNEPQFRAHAWAVGYQLASMVEYSADAALLEALVRKNAKSHTTRAGVKPEHFALIGQTVIEVMKNKHGKFMTPAAVAAWEKLITCMGKVTAMVYEEEKDRAPEASPKPEEKGADVPSTASESTVSEGGGIAEASKAAAEGTAPALGAHTPTAVGTETPVPKHDQPAAPLKLVDQPAAPDSAAHGSAATPVSSASPPAAAASMPGATSAESPSAGTGSPPAPK